MPSAVDASTDLAHSNDHRSEWCSLRGIVQNLFSHPFRLSISLACGDARIFERDFQHTMARTDIYQGGVRSQINIKENDILLNTPTELVNTTRGGCG